MRLRKSSANRRRMVESDDIIYSMTTEILIRFLLAALWGGIVGMEREYHGKSAGFRTMIMISLGACFFTIVSQQLGGEANGDRIAANIVTGIGFLGAGVIFRGGENRVSGITTAATIWTVAAIGMGIGSGAYIAAAYASVLVIIVLAVLPYAEKMIDQISQTRSYVLRIRYFENAAEEFEAAMISHRLQVKRTGVIRDGGLLSISWEVRGAAKRHDAFCTSLHTDSRVEYFAY